ncbi:MAG: diguanylate cyclase (GGDEF)-like protein/PAS domain S-box-containing protein [Crocinitomicaceae bacterium]|jgi:diguanylate cyclase (GGDEF)-like protein/PAS domain S-box-containing protein
MDIWKIFFRGLALTIFITLTSGIYTLSIVKSDFDIMVAESLRVVRDATHLAIKAWAVENENHIKILAQDPNIISLTEKLLATNQSQDALLKNPAQQTLRNYLKPVLSGYELRGFFIISRANLNLASTRDNNTGITNLTIRKTEFNRRVWDGETLISSPQESDVPLKDQQGKLIEHYPTMFVGSPIRNSQGKIIAILTLRIDPTAKLREIAQIGRIGQTGESYLIDRQGYLLTKSRFEEELIRKKLLNTGERSTFNIQANESTVNVNNQKSSFTRMVSSVIEGGAGINIEGYIDYRGEIVVGAWAWEPKLMFGIVTKIDKEEVFIPYNRTKQSFILFTTGAMLFFGIFSWLFVHIHTRMQANINQADTLFENAGEPILIIDNKSGNIISANKLTSKLLKYSQEELLGLNISSLREKSTRGKVPEDLKDVNKNGFKLIKTYYCDKNGKKIPVEVSAKLVSYGNSEVILSIIRDVTNNQKSLAQLQESESRLKSTQAYAKMGYWELLADKETALWSEQVYALFGLVPESKLGPEMLHHVMHKEDFPTFTTSIKACFATGQEHKVECRITRPSDGEERWIECRGQIVIQGDGGPQKISGFIQDITERKNAEEKLQLFSRMFSDTHEGIIITDPQQYIVDVNPAFSRITGYSHAEIIGKPASILNSGKQSSVFYARMWQSIAEKGFWQGELWNRKKQGELYAELLNISSLKNDNDEVTNYVGLFSDITSSKQYQEQLNLMAHYDLLTKLPNRALFIDRFNQSIAHSKRTGHQLAVCFLDLDNFKPVNDNYGHEAGDRLLIEVAERIKNCLREEDTLSRQGGDEFAILLNDIESASEYEGTIKRIHQALTRPYFINDVQHNITASSGVTLYPSDDGDIDTLLRHADHAMYESKLSGKHRSHLYSPDSDQRIIKKNLQLDEIEQALVNHEFQLYYQPKVNMVTGNVFGAEALIRWIHPEKGLIPPLDFLPLIDGTPLEIKIGKWVISEALQQLDHWQQQGVILEVSVNISSSHLLSPSFVLVLEKCLAEHPAINSNFLQLEILESSALGDINKITDIIETCQNQLGVSFSLDDFGTGYSSLTHLRSLPVDMIKIDQSFVRDMLDDPSDYSIIEGVLALTNTFNRSVIAEGVETTNHGLMLLLMGCEQAQGYAIAKPMPASVFLQWLSDYTPNKNWLLCGNKPRNNKENSLEVFRMISDQWKAKLRKKIVSSPDDATLWPFIDSHRCHCGNWIHQKKQEQLFEKESLQQLEKAHNKIHIIANAMQRKYQAGELDTARAVLADLDLAFDNMNNAIN